MRMTNEELVAEYQNGNEKVFDELLASNPIYQEVYYSQNKGGEQDEK